MKKNHVFLKLFLVAAIAAHITDAAAGLLNVKQSGAVGDGVADDTEALQQTLDRARRERSGVYIPTGTYLITRPLRVKMDFHAARAMRIEGEYAIIKANTEMEAVLDIDTSQFLTIKRLILDGNNLARHGFKAFRINYRAGLVEQVTVKGATSHGFFLDKCVGSVFRNCQSTGNGGDGWHVIDANATVFDAVMAMSNKGNGYSILSKDYSGGCTLANAWSEKNDGHGILVSVHKLNATVFLNGGWVESNGLDGVRIESIGTVVQGLQVFGQGKDENRAIRVTETASGSHITGNYVQREPGPASYGRIRVEGDPAKHYIEGNFYRYKGTFINPEVDRLVE